MSVDSLVAPVGGNADLAALIDAELAALAADAQALRALLVEGAVVTARVMPSNGLTDLLEIAGRRVAASLPPTVRPGDALQVQVTGFDGDRILLRIIGTGADAAVEPGPPSAATAPDAAVFVAAAIRRSDAGPAAASAPDAAASAPDAPPAAAAPPAAPPTPPGRGAAAFAAVRTRANVVPSQAGATEAAEPPVQTVIATGEPTSIEARIAAARAAVPLPAAPAAPPSAAAGAPAGSRFVAPPQIAPKSAPSAAPAVVIAPAAALPARSTGLSAYAEPVALLRALKLPVTPGNVAAAALALQRPDRLPAALAALERALPAGDDPHVATLRALLGFVGRIDPRSPVLATQIAAYVEQVVDGNEPKLATLLAATRAAAAVPGPAEPHRSIPAAVAAERRAALGTDLKQTLLAVAADPATPEALAPALANALTALTAVQLNAAQTLAAQPDGIAFTIPLTTAQGTASAHISVKRDAPGAPGTRLDGENFHIAFVLDTAHYGTVAIDLVTVGREVTVEVRTESAPALRSFRDALSTLTTRLEALRYRVASAGASIGPTSTVSIGAAPARPVDPDAVVDRSA